MKSRIAVITILSFLIAAHWGAAPALAQSTNQLSPEEIKAAMDAKPGSGFVFIEDGGFMTPSNCQAQMPSEAVFTPEGWINALSSNAKKQFLAFEPKGDDTARYLRVVSRGCANGTPAGPACTSITRVVLLSDKEGTLKAEAVLQEPLREEWQNRYGASAACDSLRSAFSMADVQKLRNTNGEFLIATFNGPTLLKLYTVKQKHIKRLGL